MKAKIIVSADEAPSFIMKPFHRLERSDMILESLQEALDTHSELNRVHLAVTGPPGTGKSAIAKHFAMANQGFWRKSDGDELITKPIIYVSLPRGASPAVTASRIARAIGLANYNSKTEKTLTHEILDAIQRHEIKMIIIDEAQHIRVSRIKPSDDVRHLLKDLDNEGKVNIAFFGTDGCEDVITMDDQLNTRFANHLKLEKFHLRDELNLKQFRSLLRKIDSSTPIAKSSLDSEVLTLSLFLASGGVLRTLLQIVGYSLKYAITDGSTKIRKKHFAQAYDKYKRPLPFVPFNPFEVSNNKLCNHPESLKTVAVK